MPHLADSPASRLMWALALAGCSAREPASSAAVDATAPGTASTPTAMVTAAARPKRPASKPLPERMPETAAWSVDADAALAQGRAETRPVLIHFTADWCAPCVEMERTTFSDVAFRVEARWFIPVRVDMTNDELPPAAAAARDRFRVTGVPLVVVVDTRGNERERIAEFVEPEELLAKLRRID